MNTRRISISFVVNAGKQVAFRDLSIDWIESDNAGTIAEDIKEAILNIE